MYLCHVAWMIWVCVVASLGRFWCAWSVGSASDAAWVDKAVPSLVVGRDWYALCSFCVYFCGIEYVNLSLPVWCCSFF